MKLILFVLIALPNSIFASDIDQSIDRYIEMFNLGTPKRIQNLEMEKYRFGEKLFSDNQLSLENNISCHTCHSTDFGSSDALPFSIGTGGAGEGSDRKKLSADTTPRSSPHLFNKGHKSVKTMFWDGRVRYSEAKDEYTTPEPGLNGKSPKLAHIRDKIENVMAMQALFPIVNPSEMLGKKQTNLSNTNAWEIVAKRIKNDPSYKQYTSSEDFNIADIANALSYFQTIKFQVLDTPFDAYINGEKSALSKVEKLGLDIFLNKGRCVRCHNGVLLSNNAFQGVAAPQTGEGITEDKDDLGFYHGSSEKRGKYLFKNQPLRNIALTAPFMHSGSLLDLKAVIEHYDDPINSLRNYDVSNVSRKFFFNYDKGIFHKANDSKNEQRLRSLAPVIRMRLDLTDTEKRHLLCFLKKSLTEKKYHSTLDLSACTY